MSQGLAHRFARRFLDGRLIGQPEPVAVEEPLEIRVAGDPVAITMRTPGEDTRLALGYLFSEGILRSSQDVGSVSHCGRPGEPGYGNVVDVLPAGGARLPLEKLERSRRGTVTVAACGVCGRRTIDDLLASCGALPGGARISRRVLAHSTGQLSEAQPNFAQSGGVHAALALDEQGRTLAAFEDIGRHNAVDKVIGDLLIRGLVPARNSPTAPLALVVSGRTSFEIVQKAAAAAIPVVSSISAASTLAIDLADQANITLVSFVRDGRFTILTHPERVFDLPPTEP